MKIEEDKLSIVHYLNHAISVLVLLCIVLVFVSIVDHIVLPACLISTYLVLSACLISRTYLFTLLKRQAEKYCSLICCERKTSCVLKCPKGTVK